MSERYLLRGGPAGGRTGDTNGAHTIQVPNPSTYAYTDRGKYKFCHEYRRSTAVLGTLRVFLYLGEVLRDSWIEFHPNRGDLAEAQLRLDWDQKVQPLLDELGITIDSEASGYEVDGHAAYANRGRAVLTLHQEGHM